MVFVFLGFMIMGIALIIDGIDTKDPRAVNNGIIITLIMLLSIIYTIMYL